MHGSAGLLTAHLATHCRQPLRWGLVCLERIIPHRGCLLIPPTQCPSSWCDSLPVSSAIAWGKNSPNLALVSAPGVPVLLKTTWNSKAAIDANRESKTGYFLLCCTSASLLGVSEGAGTIALGLGTYTQSLQTRLCWGWSTAPWWAQHPVPWEPLEFNVKYCTGLFKLGAGRQPQIATIAFYSFDTCFLTSRTLFQCILSHGNFKMKWKLAISTAVSPGHTLGHLTCPFTLNPVNKLWFWCLAPILRYGIMHSSHNPGLWGAATSWLQKAMGFLSFHITYMVAKMCPQFNSHAMLLLLIYHIFLVKFSVPLWIKAVKGYSNCSLLS